MRISSDDFSAFDHHKRIRFVNMLSGVRTAFLLSTADKVGKPNLAIFNSIIHIGASPPLLGFIMRPLSVERHSYENIKATGTYTLNAFPPDLIEKAHNTSKKFARNVSEFDALQIEEEWINDFPAPFVKDAVLKIALQFREETFIQSNDTRLIVGEIKFVEFPEGALEPDGHLRHEDLHFCQVSGLESYYTLKPLKRIKYK